MNKNTVVNFPILDTLIVFSFFNIKIEPKSTDMSLTIIPQKKNSDKIGLNQNINNIKTVLSTNGSMMVPNFVTALYLLARWPSRASDKPMRAT